MKQYSFLTIFLVFLLSMPVYGQTPQAPIIQVLTQDTQVDINWSSIAGASGYELYYAAYPYTGPSSIASIDVANGNSLSTNLWSGAAFYVALQSYNFDGHSEYSNIELIKINATEESLPQGIVMKTISGGTFIMGNNALLGPQANDATEHQVTLSDFEMSEAEITNAQYVVFLNAAYAAGLLEVSSGNIGADMGKSLIVGSSTSSYADKVLYELSGTRVMKDHDNGDGDSDSFTGSIEPENPLNIADIGFDLEKQQFYVKDPHSVVDFNWLQLTNYYDYSTASHIEDKTQQLNDFDVWSELTGWKEANPEAGTALPTQAQVADYPVTLIRWWGAYAFSLYYEVKLPTEAQWEYAAKGGSHNYFYAVYDGASVDDANWNSLVLNPATHHVRAAISGKANPFGLYNLGGNVWEWMADNYQAYNSSAVSEPLIEISGSTSRSWRGGSWNYHQSTLESSGRFFDNENVGNDHFGFRIAR